MCVCVYVWVSVCECVCVCVFVCVCVVLIDHYAVVVVYCNWKLYMFYKRTINSLYLYIICIYLLAGIQETKC